MLLAAAWRFLTSLQATPQAGDQHLELTSHNDRSLNIKLFKTVSKLFKVLLKILLKGLPNKALRPFFALASLPRWTAVVGQVQLLLPASG